jgi:anti-anti-sigma regulatory factor
LLPCIIAEGRGGLMSGIRYLQVERLDQTIVVTPPADLSGIELDDLRFSELGGTAGHLELQQAKHLVIDCRHLLRCSSSGIAEFIRLGKRSRAHRGRMALCSLSRCMRQTYDVLNLKVLWPAFDSLDEALRYVQEAPDTVDGPATLESNAERCAPN